jgi:hypothetical protein
MKTTLIFKTVLAVLLCGVICASEYTLEDTLEPEPIPGFNPLNEVEAPAKILPSEKTEDTSLVRPGDIPVKPPKLVRTDSGQLILVQYTSRSQHNSRNQGQSKQPAASPAVPSTELPQSYRDFNSMSESERLASIKKSIETVLIANARRGVNTQNHTPNEVLLMALPYGADARVYRPFPNVDPRDKNAPKGEYIYSIGALCWNTPCNGKTLCGATAAKSLPESVMDTKNVPPGWQPCLPCRTLCRITS